MKIRSVLRGILCPLGLLMLLGVAFTDRAAAPCRFNREALLFVSVGTALMLWLAYPAKEVLVCFWWSLSGAELSDTQAQRAEGILCYAAEMALRISVVGVILGLVAILRSFAEPYRVLGALSRTLASLLGGMFLSECIFAPLSRRFAGAEAEKIPESHRDAKRRSLAFFGFFAALFGILAAIVLLMSLPGGLHPDASRPLLEGGRVAMVLGAVFLVLWTAFPLGDISRALLAGFMGRSSSKEEARRSQSILSYAAHCALLMSAFTAVIVIEYAILIMPWHSTFIGSIISAIGLATVGIALAEVVFPMMSRRIDRRNGVVERGG